MSVKMKRDRLMRGAEKGGVEMGVEVEEDIVRMGRNHVSGSHFSWYLIGPSNVDLLEKPQCLFSVHTAHLFGQAFLLLILLLFMLLLLSASTVLRCKLHLMISDLLSAEGLKAAVHLRCGRQVLLIAATPQFAVGSCCSSH